MTTELNNSVEYTVLVQAFKHAQISLERAHTKKKAAKAERLKGEKTATAKTDFSILVWQFKRAKHKFKAKAANLKIIQTRLKNWLKLNAPELSHDVLAELGIIGDKKSDLKRHAAEAKVVKVKSEKQLPVAVKNAITDDSKHKKVKTDKPKTESVKKAISPELKAKAKEKSIVESAKISTNDTVPVDLLLIEGIGPKVNQILATHKVESYEALAKMSVESINQILRSHRIFILDPSTWAEQAQLILDNKTEELKTLQASLFHGKRSK